MPSNSKPLKKIVLLILFFFIVASVYSQDTSYLAGFPSAEKANTLLKSEFSSRDTIRNCAKRISALGLFSDFITIMGYERSLTPREVALRQDYEDLVSKVKNDFSNSLPTNDLRNSFQQSCTQWDGSKVVEDIVLNYVVSPDTKIKLVKMMNYIEDEPTRKKNTHKMYVMGFFLFGIVSIVCAFMIKYNINKYEFNNRTDGGVIMFRDHGASVWHNMKRGIAQVLYM